MVDNAFCPPDESATSSDALSGVLYKRLVEAVTDYAIYMLDTDGRVATWNTGAQRIKGYTVDEIIGRHFSTFFTPEDIADGKPARALQIAGSTGRFEDEGWRCRKDGSRFWAMAVLDAIYDDNGVLIGFAKITRDMTERRQAECELQEARDQLFQSQKLEALGQLTGGVAHDFNNLLAAVLSGLSLIERRAQGDESLSRITSTMREVVERGQGLTNHLLTFSRRQKLAPKHILLQNHMPSLLGLLRQLLGDNIRIVADLPSDLWGVMADSNQLDLALLNICLNARDAMPNGGSLTISAANEMAGDARGTGGDRNIVLKISDTGSGVPPEILPRIFEPFFTTKDIGKGSGLGLSQAYGFAAESGGSIQVESTVGSGTSVILRLPAAADKADALDAGAPTSAEPETRARSGTVLLVEDDAALAELTVALLEDYGFTVKLAKTAAVALGLIRDDGPYDVVLCDVVTPGGVTGLDLARTVRNERPSLPVVLLTGYSRTAKNAKLEGIPLLNKPCRTDQLLGVLDNVIPGRRGHASIPSTSL